MLENIYFHNANINLKDIAISEQKIPSKISLQKRMNSQKMPLNGLKCHQVLKIDVLLYYEYTHKLANLLQRTLFAFL